MTGRKRNLSFFIGVLIFSLGAGVNPVVAQAQLKPIQKSRNGLIAVIGLAEHAKRYRFLYEQEEKAAIGITEKYLAPHYEAFIPLYRADATFDHFLAAVRSLQSRSDVEQIDLVIYLHGHRHELCFNGKKECEPSHHLPERIKSPQKLRAVYSDACWGATHMDDLLASGFKAVSGAIDQDVNHTADYRRFVRAWTKGHTFSESIDYANRYLLNPILNRLGNGNSTKLKEGDSELRLISPVPKNNP